MGVYMGVSGFNPQMNSFRLKIHKNKLKIIGEAPEIQTTEDFSGYFPVLNPDAFPYVGPSSWRRLAL